MEAIFSNDDLAMEILSRLSASELSRFKCISKRWKNLISNPSFLHLHQQRSRLRGISLLLVQQYHEKKGNIQGPWTFLDCAPLQDERHILKILRSVPRQTVVLTGSSDGLICCRTRRTWPEEVPEILICNPITKEWISLIPTNCHVGHIFAFGFYPFGSSSKKAPCFKVVSIQRQKYDQNSYSFVIYSSETGKWKTSLEVCHCKDNLHENKHIHIRGRFYWLTKNQRIISFDVEQELSGIIKSPGPMRSDGGLTSACLGDTDGYLHYACADDSDLRVWMLIDHRKLDWVLKHQLNLNQFRMKRPSPVTDYFRHRGYGLVKCRMLGIFAPDYLALGTLTFYDEVIYMMIWGRLQSYNFRNGELKHLHMFGAFYMDHHNIVPAIVLPYSVTLAANGVLRVIQNSIDALISVPATVLLYSATPTVSAILTLKHVSGDASFFVASNASTYRVRRKRKEPIKSPLV
jgi:F-box interacting protein|uniref:Uncharacterized protein n=1 Tax=Fagus sylvatica TaxID=28930 RepID=A0A2N9GZK4_FAGSY